MKVPSAKLKAAKRNRNEGSKENRIKAARDLEQTHA